MSNSIPGLAIYRGSRRYQEVGYFSRIAIVCNAGILISEVSVPDVASYSRRNSTPSAPTRPPHLNLNIVNLMPFIKISHKIMFELVEY